MGRGVVDPYHWLQSQHPAIEQEMGQQTMGLIAGSFHPCPRCGQMQLGTLSIRVNVHSRRCRHCFHNESERLPPLNKKLIYLDQTVGCAFW